MTLSDHIPVVCIFVLQSQQLNGARKSLYFKMDANLIDSTEMWEKIEGQWRSQMSVNRDARINWDLAWAATRRLLQTEQKKRKEQRNQRNPGEELQQIHIQVGRNPSTDNINKLRVVDNEIREREKQDANKARKNSRVRWLQMGEAPSKYFFNQLKAKHAWENIRSLKLDNGECTANEEQILEEIFRFYEELYSYGRSYP